MSAAEGARPGGSVAIMPGATTAESVPPASASVGPSAMSGAPVAAEARPSSEPCASSELGLRVGEELRARRLERHAALADRELVGVGNGGGEREFVDRWHVQLPIVMGLPFWSVITEPSSVVIPSVLAGRDVGERDTGSWIARETVRPPTVPIVTVTT